MSRESMLSQLVKAIGSFDCALNARDAADRAYTWAQAARTYDGGAEDQDMQYLTAFMNGAGWGLSTGWSKTLGAP